MALLPWPMAMMAYFLEVEGVASGPYFEPGEGLGEVRGLPGAGRDQAGQGVERQETLGAGQAGQGGQGGQGREGRAAGRSGKMILNYI